MKASLIVIVCAVFLVGGCAVPGQQKAGREIMGEGLSHTGLIFYDIGAMTINTAWGIGTLGYGFNEGHTLLPLYDPHTGKFIAHKF